MSAGPNADRGFSPAQIVANEIDANGFARDRTLNLNRPRLYEIGREELCDLRLASSQVSRRHARLEPFGSGWRFVDLNSRNGSFLNGHRTNVARLSDGDTLRLGDTKLVFRVMPAPRAPTDTDLTDMKSIDHPRQGVAAGLPRRKRHLTILGIGVAASLALVAVGGTVLYEGAADPEEAKSGGTPTAAAVPATTGPTSESEEATLPNVSIAEILGNGRSDTRAFRLEANERIVAIEFSSLADQAKSLNRVATFIERAGAPRDRVLGDSELGNYISSIDGHPDTYFFGHDYRITDFARFLNQAQAGGVQLNKSERSLVDLLLTHGVLEKTEEGYRAVDPPGAVISFPRTQADNPDTPQSELVDPRLRETIFRHELSHGEYFTNPDYREHAHRVWNERMTEQERQAFLDFLATADYDTGNLDLVVNEMQAFLMHTPDNRAFHGGMIGLGEAQLADLKRRFMEGAPAQYLFDRAGSAFAGGADKTD